MHVFTEIVNAVGIRRAPPHGQRSAHFPAPALLIFGARLRRVVAPGIKPALVAAARGAFPFRLGRQAIMAAGQALQPLAVFLRFEPTDGDHRMVRIVESGLLPVGRRRMPGGLHENGEVPVAHLVNRHLKSIHPNAMHGALLIAALLTTHQEIPGGNHHAGGFDDSLRSLIAAGGTLRVGRRNHGADSAEEVSGTRCQVLG